MVAVSAGLGDGAGRREREDGAGPADEGAAVTAAPPVLSVAVSLLAAAVAVASLAVAAALALPVAGVGVLGLAAGLLGGRRRWVTGGSVGLFVAALLAGVQGAPPEPLLVALLGTVVAWDVGEHGVGLGEQLGREARSRRAVAVHAAAATAVGAAATVLGYGGYLAVSGGQPTTAVVFLLVGVVALVAALRA